MAFQIYPVIVLTAALLSATPNSSEESPLTAKIADLDAKLFDSYNRCDLATFGGYFDPHVVFLHDTGGATFDRETVVANTKKYICGKVRRELLPSTVHIYPIKDFGALEEGEHRFCEVSSGKCEGIAKFVIVWAQREGTWRITQVLSYGHRAMTEEERKAIQASEH